MTKANYTFEIEKFLSYNFISIVDLDQGGMSVTNDIENVVNEICQEAEINKGDYLIIYQDSEGIWDGWDGSFIPLSGISFREAAEIYINKLNS